MKRTNPANYLLIICLISLYPEFRKKQLAVVRCPGHTIHFMGYGERDLCRATDRNGWNPTTRGSPIYYCSQAQPGVFRVRILIRDTRPISWFSQPFVSTHKTPTFPDPADSVKSLHYIAPSRQERPEALVRG